MQGRWWQNSRKQVKRQDRAGCDRGIVGRVPGTQGTMRKTSFQRYKVGCDIITTRANEEYDRVWEAESVFCTTWVDQMMRNRW